MTDSDRVPTADAPQQGPSSALLTVVVFGDFQCPYCARGRQVLRDLEAVFPGQVRVVWRHLPLRAHPLAHSAAEASMEVRVAGGDAAFWRYNDLLFAHQPELTRDVLLRDAEAVGVPAERVARALEEGAHRDEVDGDAALAERLGVDATPAFLLNGSRIVGLLPFATFERAARQILARAGSIADRASVYADMARDPVAVELPSAAPRATVDAWIATHDVPVPATAPSRGPAGAPVVTQVFSDFECPFCARVLPTLDALRTQYGERLRVVWRDFPLPRHAHALLAAEAGREVMAQHGSDAFWRYHDAIFAAQTADEGLTPGAITRVAVAAGADPAALARALEDHRHRPAIDADLAAATATGVRLGTPAFFINGHFVSGARPLADFRERIDGLLRDAR